MQDHTGPNFALAVWEPARSSTVGSSDYPPKLRFPLYHSLCVNSVAMKFRNGCRLRGIRPAGFGQTFRLLVQPNYGSAPHDFLWFQNSIFINCAATFTRGLSQGSALRWHRLKTKAARGRLLDKLV